METAGRIIRVAREEAGRGGVRPTIVVDEIGIGGGLVDRLQELGEFKVESFNGAAAPRDAKEYPNKRSQAWFDFAERLAGIDLDDDEQLAADLTAPIYKIDSAGRRVVEPKADTKKRLGRSPDRADAVLMAFASMGGAGALMWCYRCEPGHDLTGPNGHPCGPVGGEAVHRRGDLLVSGPEDQPSVDIESYYSSTSTGRRDWDES